MKTKFMTLLMLACEMIAIASLVICLLCGTITFQAYNESVSRRETTFINSSGYRESTSVKVSWDTNQATRTVETFQGVDRLDSTTETYLSSFRPPKIIGENVFYCVILLCLLARIITTFWHFSMNGCFIREMLIVHCSTILIMVLVIVLSNSLLQTGVQISSTLDIEVSGDSERVRDYVVETYPYLDDDLPDFEQDEVTVSCIAEFWPFADTLSKVSYWYASDEQIIVLDDMSEIDGMPVPIVLNHLAGSMISLSVFTVISVALKFALDLDKTIHV